MSRPTGASEEQAPQSIDEVIDARAVVPVFQPLVHLEREEVVGYEALARGPRSTAWESPGPLFAAAAAAGRLGELDWVCRTAGLRAALDADLDPSLGWFINVEPAALSSPCPDDLQPVIEQARGRLRVVTELTERAVDQDPARLLAAAATARGNSWGVALDDVGSVPRSLSLLPFVQPDIVKLDLSLVQGREDDTTPAIANAVRAYAESTGAVILAEGIETDAHRETALVLGATYGQGWYFGRPGPLPEVMSPPVRPLAFDQRPEDDPGATPFEIAAAHRPVQTATKRLLLPMSLHLEGHADGATQALVLLATFQQDRHFTPATRRRYQRLGEHNVLTVALAEGMRPSGDPHLRTANLRASHPLAAEWNVIVVGPHFAGALLARDRGDACSDLDRRFEYVITHDRPLVLRAARSLLRWLTA